MDDVEIYYDHFIESEAGVRVRAGTRRSISSGSPWTERDGVFYATKSCIVTDGPDLRIAGTVRMAMAAKRVDDDSFDVGFEYATYGNGAHVSHPVEISWYLTTANGAPVSYERDCTGRFECRKWVVTDYGSIRADIADLHEARGIRVWWGDQTWTALCKNELDGKFPSLPS